MGPRARSLAGSVSPNLIGQGVWTRDSAAFQRGRAGLKSAVGIWHSTQHLTQSANLALLSSNPGGSVWRSITLEFWPLARWCLAAAASSIGMSRVRRRTAGRPPCAMTRTQADRITIIPRRVSTNMCRCHSRRPQPLRRPPRRSYPSRRIQTGLPIRLRRQGPTVLPVFLPLQVQPALHLPQALKPGPAAMHRAAGTHPAAALTVSRPHAAIRR